MQPDRTSPDLWLLPTCEQQTRPPKALGLAGQGVLVIGLTCPQKPFRSSDQAFMATQITVARNVGHCLRVRTATGGFGARIVVWIVRECL